MAITCGHYRDTTQRRSTPLATDPLTSGVAAPQKGGQIRESRGQPQDTARVRARARARARVCAREERYPAKYRVASARPLIQRGRARWASIRERHRVSAEQADEFCCGFGKCFWGFEKCDFQWSLRSSKRANMEDTNNKIIIICMRERRFFLL